jgi:UDP-N-acetylmuramyl pentapeptide phosphotransferase/UDP-N-acetylglucosamine-1-phosphate transferase
MSITTFSILLFLGSFLTSFVLIPKIRAIAKNSNFNSIPNHRSSHKMAVPNIGGVAFFVSLMLSFYFIENFDFLHIISTIIPGLTIIFIIGLKDDLVLVAPSTKIFAQIISGLFLASHPAFELLNLKGFIGVFEINFYIGLLIVVFLNVVIINAINLIDGIDSLAGIISILIFGSYGVLYFKLEQYFFTSLCIVMIGSLLAFLRFNISKEKKIFMGDTGSMIVGFLISIMTLRLLTTPIDEMRGYHFQLQNLPFLIFAFLSLPIIDMLRVFILRIIDKKSPFAADRNHCHHIILDYYGWSHVKVSLFLATIYLINVLIFTYLMNSLHQAIIFVIIFILLISYFYTLSKMKTRILVNTKSTK